MLAGIIPFKMMLIPWYIKILLKEASFAPNEDKIPIIFTLSKINVKIDIVTLTIAINTIRTVITIMLKSKIETQLNMFSYFVVIDLTDKLFFSIELNNKEISRGGEYNNLMKTLGYKKQINAFGGAIDLNQLLN